MSDYPATGVKNMENKKAQSYSAIKSEDTHVTTAKMASFLGDVKSEFKKINWTTPEELKVYTKIVVGMTFFLGMGIYIVDLLIQLVLSGLNAIFQWIG